MIHRIQDVPWIYYLAILAAPSKVVIPSKELGAPPLDVRKCGRLS